MTVLKTPDDVNIVVSTDSDVRLYRAPGGQFGIDIYAHKAQPGTIYYYTHSWSVIHPAGYSLVTPKEARDRLTHLAGLPGDGRLDDEEKKTAKRYFPRIFR